MTADGVTEAILQLIADSFFCIFEVSDNNPNVMFELGNAYATQKGLILLKNAESTPLNKVPSDIVGKFITYYGGREYPTLEQLRPKVCTVIRDYVASLYYKKAETWGRRVWDIRGDTLIIVSGNLHGRYEVEPRDADAMFEATLKLLELYPGLKVKRVYSIDFKQEDFVNNDVLAIGGPDSNKVSELILNSMPPSFPFHYYPTPNPDDFILRDLISSRDFNKRSPVGRVEVDYGFFLRAPNPYDRDRNVLLVTGIGSEGTLGCSKALPPPTPLTYKYYHENFSEIATKRFFSVITEATVSESKIEGKVLKDTIVFADESSPDDWKRLR